MQQTKPVSSFAFSFMSLLKDPPAVLWPERAEQHLSRHQRIHMIYTFPPVQFHYCQQFLFPGGSTLGQATSCDTEQPTGPLSGSIQTSIMSSSHSKAGCGFHPRGTSRFKNLARWTARSSSWTHHQVDGALDRPSSRGPKTPVEGTPIVGVNGYWLLPWHPSTWFSPNVPPQAATCPEPSCLPLTSTSPSSLP